MSVLNVVEAGFCWFSIIFVWDVLFVVGWIIDTHLLVSFESHFT